jgi:hypothetical protein
MAWSFVRHGIAVTSISGPSQSSESDLHDGPSGIPGTTLQVRAPIPVTLINKPLGHAFREKPEF